MYITRTRRQSEDVAIKTYVRTSMYRVLVNEYTGTIYFEHGSHGDVHVTQVILNIKQVQAKRSIRILQGQAELCHGWVNDERRVCVIASCGGIDTL